MRLAWLGGPNDDEAWKAPAKKPDDSWTEGFTKTALPGGLAGRGSLDDHLTAGNCVKGSSSTSGLSETYPGGAPIPISAKRMTRRAVCQFRVTRGRARGIHQIEGLRCCGTYPRAVFPGRRAGQHALYEAAASAAAEIGKA